MTRAISLETLNLTVPMDLFMCWHSESHSTHGPLWNTVDICMFVIPERFFNMLHNTSTFFVVAFVTR